MKNAPKRRTTERGLGKVEETHARQQTGTRRRVIVDDAPNDVAVPAYAKPRIVADAAAIAAAPIDARAAFLLSLLDGKTIVRDLVDISGMERAEIDAILNHLTRLTIISIT